MIPIFLDRDLKTNKIPVTEVDKAFADMHIVGCEPIGLPHCCGLCFYLKGENDNIYSVDVSFDDLEDWPILECSVAKIDKQRIYGFEPYEIPKEILRYCKYLEKQKKTNMEETDR